MTDCANAPACPNKSIVVGTVGETRGGGGGMDVFFESMLV